MNANLNVRSAPLDGSDNSGIKKPPPPEKVSVRDQTTFSWENVGPWESSSIEDKSKALKVMKSIENYVVDHFYGDWYWNSSLMIGTCFFCWLIARLGGGILSLGFILLFTNSVYRAEFRRFNRDVRDDMTRVTASNRLENELETMEWLNSFMDKFWVIYMPALSEQVMFQANEVLKDQAPGFGIEALSLDEFTLGSKAPRVDSIKSYTRKGHDHIEMDWAFSFAPNDTDDMTKNEIKRKINPKVALGVRVGKAFISKSLPILVEDMSFKGRMNIKLKLNHNFPHVKMVSIQFLEAPAIDYVLKPVGGDTFGLDIMSLIPGLASFVNGLIHANLRPMLYAPNSLDIDVEELLAQLSLGAIGCLAITVKRCTNLKPTEKTKQLHPYVQMKIECNADIDERTKVKKLISSPVFMETKYILLNQLESNFLNFNVYNLIEQEQNDKLIGNVQIPLADLLQKETFNDVTKNIMEGGKVVGKIEYDLKYFPILEPMVLEDGSKKEITESEVGIMKLTLHEAKDLDITQSVVGILNPYAEIYVNHELVKSCRRLRQNNEPSWDQTIESLITQQSETTVTVLIKDSVEDAVVGQLEANLQDLVFESGRGQEWIQCAPVRPDAPPTKVRIGATWKALGMTDENVDTHFNASIGGLRIHLRSATGLKNLEAVGKVDPYVRVMMNGNIRGKTLTIADTLDPAFNHVCFVPIANDHQHILLEVMDEEADQNDRSLGTCAVHVNEFLKKNDEGYYLGYDGSNEIIEQPVLLNGQHQGFMSYSVSFVPTIPVYTLSQMNNKDKYLEHLKKKEADEAEQRRKDEKKFKEHPDEYQWVDIEDDELPEVERIHMPLETAIKYRTGNINVYIEGGKFSKPDFFVHTLFDDHAYPSSVTARTEGRKLDVKSKSEAFIRDLPNSKLIFRLAKKFEVDKEKDIVHEKTFDTLEILKRSYDNPIDLKINEKNTIRVQLEYIPSAVKLAPFDTILDVGKFKLDILSAEGLKSVDSNGKSDPFLSVKLDGVEIYKTDKKRKTLDPVWNESVDIPLMSRSRQIVLLEVYDWDLTHKPDLLGRINLDMSTIEPLRSTQFTVNFDTQGILNLRGTFRPEYLRPTLDSESGLPLDLSSVANVPLKAVGGGVGLAADGVGMAANGVGGVGKGLGKGVGKGGSFIKGFGRLKKKQSMDEEGGAQANNEFDETASHMSGRTGQTGVTGRSGAGQSQLQKREEGADHEGEEGEGREEGEGEEEEEEEGAARPGETGDPKKDEKADKMAENIKVDKPAGEVHAAPNIHADLLPPLQKPNFGFVTGLNNDSDTSSVVTSMNAPDTLPGRIAIVSAHGFSSPVLEVKTILKTATKDRTLFRTRGAKLHEDGYRWNESIPFRSASSNELIFLVRESHKFGKKVELALARLPLVEALNKTEDFTFQTGQGTLVVNVTYLDTGI